MEGSSKVGWLERGTWIIAQPPGRSTRNSSRMAFRSSSTCSRTWLHRITSNDALSLSILVTSSLTMACGLSRSADTISMFRTRRRCSASAGSGATWRTRRERPSSRSVRAPRRSQARRSRGWDRHTGQTTSWSRREGDPWERNRRQWLLHTGQYRACPKNAVRTIGRRKNHVRIASGSAAAGMSALIRDTMAKALASVIRRWSHGGVLFQRARLEHAVELYEGVVEVQRIRKVVERRVGHDDVEGVRPKGKRQHVGGETSGRRGACRAPALRSPARDGGRDV